MFFRFNSFFRRARALRLPSSEKAALRADLTSFMKAHPVSVRAPAKERLLGQRSTPAWFPVGAALLLIVLMGAGTVSAAERSLPTDPLYPVKLYVNEPLKRSLARSPEAKAQVDAEIALRRLDEASSLAQTGALTPKEQAKAETRFVEQTKRVEAQLHELRVSGKQERAIEVVTQLETAVDVRVTTAENETAATTSQRIQPLVPVLKRAKETAKELRKERRDERREPERNDRGHGNRSLNREDGDRADDKRSRKDQESSH